MTIQDHCQPSTSNETLCQCIRAIDPHKNLLNRSNLFETYFLNLSSNLLSSILINNFQQIKQRHKRTSNHGAYHNKYYKDIQKESHSQTIHPRNNKIFPYYYTKVPKNKKANTSEKLLFRILRLLAISALSLYSNFILILFNSICQIRINTAKIFLVMYSMFIFNCKTIQAKNVFYGYDNYKQPLAYNESQHTNFEIWDAPLGCERLQMCCSGRNYSCKSSAVDYFGHDTNALKFPKRQRRQLTKLFEFSAKEKFPTVLMKRKNRLVGRLIFPDTIALDKRGIKYAQLFGQGELLRIMEVEKIQQRQRTRRHISSEEYYIFGPEIEDLQSPERIIFERIRPIIRYSVLNKYLPLRIGKIRNFGAINDVDNGRLRVMYVTEANADCFCDTQCMVYDDCCHDYNNYCQPSSIEPCFYGEWSHWSTCQKTNTKDEACGGEGAQIRTRNILRGAQNIVCTQENMVFENRACFVECLQTSAYKQIAVSTSMPSFNNSQIQTSRPLKVIDITTVALLLDYRYNTSRMYRSKYHNRYSYPNSYHQLYSNQHKNISNTTSSLIPATFQLLPNDDERFDKTRHIFYCVHYELGWVNRNCAERRYKNVLRRRERICAECQPHAQLHRNTPKCASDLNDNEKGFWKLIGPLSCNGIWRRIARTNNCSCASNFPNDTAFLLV